MISWIQRYFQKHFKIVFVVVLIAVALPMVVIYSSSGGGPSGDIKVLDQPFFNVNLANSDQVRRLTLDAELSVYLRVGYPALQGAQLQQYALQRVAGLALADQLHLPVPSSEQVSKFVPTLRAFQNQEGQFDPAAYTRFGDSLKGSAGGATGADVNRVLRDDLRLTELTKLVAGPGYLQAADVKRQLERSDSTWTVDVASLNYATFNPTLNPSEETLKKFQTDNSFRYEVPARPRLSVIEFKSADFVPPTPPTEQDLRTFYNANQASFPVPPETGQAATPALDPAAPVDNFPKVRAQVEAAAISTVSRRLASETANQLTVALYERRTTAGANSPQLAEFLALQRRAPVPIAPFAPNNPPADRAWLGNYASAISRLNKDRFFSDPLPTPDGFVILLWNEALPGYTPVFSEVRERVLADYRENEKRRLFIERGNALKAQLQAAASASTGFAEKAGAEKLEVKTFTAFTLRQPPQDFPRNVVESLVQLNQGQVSNLIAAEDTGHIVYVREKKVPDLTPANPRYAEVQKQFAEVVASSGENALLGELVETELKKHAPSTPR